MTEDNNINKLFRDVFENLEVTPPVSVKMEIDKQLGPKRKFRFIFWWLPVLLLLLGGIAFAVIRKGSNESEIKQVPAVSQLNPTSVEQDHSSSDHSGVSSTESVSESGLNDGKQAAESKQSVQTSGTGSALREAKLAPGGTSQQRLTLKKGNTVRSNQKESVSEEKGRISNSGKITKNAKSGQSAKGTKKAVHSVSKSGSGSKRINDASVDSKQKLDSKQTNLSGSPQNAEQTDAESTEKENTVLPKDKSVKNELSNPSQKADSSATAKTDSLAKSIDETSKVKPPKDEPKAKKWMVELYGGPRFGVKTSKTDFVLKEATSYQIGLGFSRNLELGPLKYITLDGEYGSGKESYKQNITTNTVYFVGIDSIPYFDTITDTVPAGYTYYNNYDTTTSTIENTRNSSIARFAFGLKAQFNFDLGSGFGLAVVPGYYYSLNKFKFSDSGSVSASSSQILLGLGVYYDWNRFRFRIGLDTRYEIIRRNDNMLMDRRRSMLFNPQFGIAIKF
jgi:hypothetical protein